MSMTSARQRVKAPKFHSTRSKSNKKTKQQQQTKRDIIVVHEADRRNDDDSARDEADSFWSRDGSEKIAFEKKKSEIAKAELEQARAEMEAERAEAELHAAREEVRRALQGLKESKASGSADPVRQEEMKKELHSALNFALQSVASMESGSVMRSVASMDGGSVLQSVASVESASITEATLTDKELKELAILKELAAQRKKAEIAKAELEQVKAELEAARAEEEANAAEEEVRRALAELREAKQQMDVQKPGLEMIQESEEVEEDEDEEGDEEPTKVGKSSATEDNNAQLPSTPQPSMSFPRVISSSHSEIKSPIASVASNEAASVTESVVSTVVSAMSTVSDYVASLNATGSAIQREEDEPSVATTPGANDEGNKFDDIIGNNSRVDSFLSVATSMADSYAVDLDVGPEELGVAVDGSKLSVASKSSSLGSKRSVASNAPSLNSRLRLMRRTNSSRKVSRSDSQSKKKQSSAESLNSIGTESYTEFSLKDLPKKYSKQMSSEGRDATSKKGVGFNDVTKQWSYDTYNYHQKSQDRDNDEPSSLSRHCACDAFHCTRGENDDDNTITDYTYATDDGTLATKATTMTQQWTEW
eukprot:CAMPEP_0183732510 /NCGR_PEP_ID=MMETSP0737-20130205/38646_1 /TAXON_ID=385413 /ORGANISM="Thalassiosira miniscula, Strain CCMP1093" /LENGTH=591 /DNA_ID=CAMNT_0025965539 /DNA_START=168 /DNA_END=1940 /DNA_ORIENTATION=-